MVRSDCLLSTTVFQSFESTLSLRNPEIPTNNTDVTAKAGTSVGHRGRVRQHTPTLPWQPETHTPRLPAFA